jgi:hypothetical protein
MSAEPLLLWMSARVQGSWQQFRAAIEELQLNDSSDTVDGESDEADEQPAERRSLPLYHEARLNLQRLGHAEFFSGAAGSDWRVAPPTLAVVEHERGWIGVLAGARSSALLQRLVVAAAGCELNTSRLPACPDQIRLFASEQHQLRAAADIAGLQFQACAPAAILSSIPRIDDPAIRRPSQLPFGDDWRVEGFSPQALAWKPGSVASAHCASFGLYRFLRWHEASVFLCANGSVLRVPGQVGKYLALKASRRRIVSYNAGERRFSVPASCRPPFLIERALVLCSGVPPVYEARESSVGFLHYSNVPAQIARLTSALLLQELR